MLYEVITDSAISLPRLNRRLAQDLITHELVHTYHGQHNPTRDFTGMDDLGWFVEGLATYASGQMAHSHAGDAKAALAAGTISYNFV